MTIFDDIRKDREAGTPGDFSAAPMWPDRPIPVTGLHLSHFSNGNEESKANTRRFVRVPRLERIALAGAELHDRVVKSQNGWPHKPGWVEEALAAFRAACGEGE